MCCGGRGRSDELSPLTYAMGQRVQPVLPEFYAADGLDRVNAVGRGCGGSPMGRSACALLVSVSGSNR